MGEPRPELGAFVFALTIASILLAARHNKRIMGPLLTLVVVRTAYSILVTFVMPELDPDVDGYTAWALTISDHGPTEAILQFRTGAYIYSWCIGVIYQYSAKVRL